MTAGSSPSGTRRPSGSTSAPDAARPRPRRSRPRPRAVAGAEVVVLGERHRHRPEELVALVAGRARGRRRRARGRARRCRSRTARGRAARGRRRCRWARPQPPLTPIVRPASTARAILRPISTGSSAGCGMPWRTCPRPAARACARTPGVPSAGSVPASFSELIGRVDRDQQHGTERVRRYFQVHATAIPREGARSSGLIEPTRTASAMGNRSSARPPTSGPPVVLRPYERS